MALLGVAGFLVLGKIVAANDNATGES
jgi:hypothetical protein